VPLRVEVWVPSLGRLSFDKLRFGTTRAKKGLKAGMQLHMTPMLISIVLHPGQPSGSRRGVHRDKPPYKVFRVSGILSDDIDISHNRYGTSSG